MSNIKQNDDIEHNIVKAVAFVGGGRWSCSWCGDNFRAGHFEQVHQAFVKHFIEACEEILPKGKLHSLKSKGKKWKWGTATFYKVDGWDAYSLVSNHVKVHFAVDYDQLKAIYEANKEALATWDATVYKVNGQ